jgi:hypothetical protein
MRRTWALFAVALLFGACAKSDKTTTSSPPTQDPFSCAELRRHVSMLPASEPAGDRAELIAACEQSDWSLTTRRCIKAAPDLDEVATCARGGGCEGVARHVIAVLQSSAGSAELDLDAETLAYGERQIVDSCRRDRWSEEALACLLAVEHERDFDRCESLIESPKEEREADAPRRLDTQPATCDGVARHVIAMARRELAGLDDEMQKMAEAMLDPMADEIREKCGEERWSEEAMACMVAARTEADFAPCEALARPAQAE